MDVLRFQIPENIFRTTSRPTKSKTMRRKRNAFEFFANPFVVLADVMVSLVCIIALFLLSTTVYSEQMELIALRDARRQAIASALIGQLSAAKLIKPQKPPANQAKYQIGDALEVEDDGTLQRFRFTKGWLDFKPNSTQFASPQMASRVLRAFGKVLLRERPRIKSIVIEGHAAPGERNPWPLASARAERVRALWQSSHVLGDVREDYKTPIFRFLTTHTLSGEKVDYRASVPKIWDPKRFHKWHLQEYQAAREPFNDGAGVLPSAWVIASGRGDQVRRAPIVEFKIEYTERDAPPLDDLLRLLSPELQKEARRLGLEKGKS